MKPDCYKVSIRRKIPYLTKLFFGLFLFFIACNLVGSLIMFPAKYLPFEMKAIYFFLFLSENMQKFIAFSSLGMITSYIIFRYVRTNQNANLSFHHDKISIHSKSRRETIKIQNLIKVIFIDMEDKNTLEEKFLVYFEQKRKKFIRLKLENYEECGEFMNEFIEYLPHKNVQYEFENIDYDPDLSNEIATAANKG